MIGYVKPLRTATRYIITASILSWLSARETSLHIVPSLSPSFKLLYLALRLEPGEQAVPFHSPPPASSILQLSSNGDDAILRPMLDGHCVLFYRSGRCVAMADLRDALDLAGVHHIRSILIKWLANKLCMLYKS